MLHSPFAPVTSSTTATQSTAHSGHFRLRIICLDEVCSSKMSSRNLFCFCAKGALLLFGYISHRGNDSHSSSPVVTKVTQSLIIACALDAAVPIAYDAYRFARGAVVCVFRENLFFRFLLLLLLVLFFALIADEQSTTTTNRNHIVLSHRSMARRIGKRLNEHAQALVRTAHRVVRVVSTTNA